ncbi:potassium/proton antiporter, CPA1 family [Microlunatus sagamiharensis]|uniref:Potassium/proton antiporter, CPA1 family n=1 Tax=Microlunatus sagamiharensis TaxID=546874 RepID=A0A1H2ND19_9ACTN|nr:potassium/proton antiporter [Microlunatus sagamiharensis]SDV03367.1 potassium/proton antiporter, CPA1 family [Microlunatus sagamiharensis]
MIDLDVILLVGAVVLIVAILAARLGSGFGLPSLLLFLGLGMLLGTDGPGGLAFDDADLAHALGFAALVLILAEGGLTTKWSEIRPVIGPALVLATIGIVVSVGAVTAFGYYVLGLDIWVAVLLGAVISPTDAAAVFSVLRRVPIPYRIRGMLEAESGLNDAPTVLLVTLASGLAAGHEAEGGPLLVGTLVVLELVGGVVTGAVMGWIGVQILRRVALPSSGLYPLATLGWAVLAYGITSTAHASGFAAVYVCAVLLGNAQLPHRAAMRSFVEGIGWIAQIGLFVMLGLLATPSRVTLEAALVGVAAGLFVTFVARPLSVWVSLRWFKVPLREQAFLSWAGLRGAVPIVLATVPLADGIDDGLFFFDVVLVFVVVFTCLQAPTLPFLARRLGLIDDRAARDVEVEAAPLDQIAADLLQVRVPTGSRLAGMEVSELRLPVNTVVSLIIRDASPFNPGSGERIKVGDELLIVTPAASRALAEERLHDLAQGGRLARWRRARPASS